MQGLVFDIKRYAIHDGPGIRTTVFLKGCPLKCWWCHNPESISTEPEEVIKVNKIGDQSFEFPETVGKYMTVEEVMLEIEKERVFYEESGGGVTFSGGEPLMQPEFLFHLLVESKNKGLHTVVDTSGHVSKKVFMQIIDQTDLFLYDLKHMDNEWHKKYVGVPNNVILDNLDFLSKKGKKAILRFPVIPGMNDTEENLSALKTFLLKIKSDQINEIDLLPYHDIAKSKYKRFQKENKMRSTLEPSKERIDEIKKEFEDLGFLVKIGG